MSFPEEYNATIYKQNNKHLSKFNSIELINHYNTYGKHEGLISTNIKNRKDFFNLINQSKQILEIGPLCFPISNVNNPNVKTLDYFTQDELKNSYKNDTNVNINKIVRVDYCVKNIINYTDIINEKFDYCISSHNIEHTPCIVTFLKNISSILNTNGYFFLAIPDYRYCFDKFRKPSDIFEVLEKYYKKTNKPQSYERLENMYYTTHNLSNDHWNDFKNTYTNEFVRINMYENFIESKENVIISDIDKIKNIIEQNDNSDYIDTHCWKLNPAIFRSFINILFNTKLIDLKVERIYKTLLGSNEFYAILKKCEN